MDILLKYVKKSLEKSTRKENTFDSLRAIQKYFLNLNEKNNNYIFFNRETTNNRLLAKLTLQPPYLYQN